MTFYSEGHCSHMISDSLKSLLQWRVFERLRNDKIEMKKNRWNWLARSGICHILLLNSTFLHYSRGPLHSGVKKCTKKTMTPLLEWTSFWLGPPCFTPLSFIIFQLDSLHHQIKAKLRLACFLFHTTTAAAEQWTSTKYLMLMAWMIVTFCSHPDVSLCASPT